ncbi:HD domain-containing phosphohydrolase [Sinanaerobacter chloroacetimidivorans]|jgi:putative two-component system response regulator|uniref:Stage 0 sporulation protein A homolog n=1 Tax=Sinanaerobacter chloroacetimidivorans TaxID=2818044 RepID=A0A8J7VZ52_9FIRM|nr:HD domain-containing phosphohydrolase [Sinanaerobacter chloroacetimidivorans]MBR0596310.1 response regulator [Sinanaerobacter chloroacetimidivorans]
MSKVLVVDDEKSMRITLSEFLSNDGYETASAPDAQSALKMIEEEEFDIILTDIIMPKISGIELLSQIREKSQTVQVIIMTGEPTVDTAVKAVQSGANDYLTKPIKRDVLLKAIRHAEQIKLLNDEKLILEKENLIYQKGLEGILLERTTALQNAMQGIITLLSSVVEARDPYTAGHQRRVGNLSAAIADRMNLGTKVVEFMRIIGYIHDVGKIVIPTEILSKPGTLNPLEMQMIRTHALSGYDMLLKVDLPSFVGETIFQHHERCDGSGYPRGLKDKDITVEAKIIMVADVVEAMMSHRPYRPALGLDAALHEIQQNAGVYYHQDIVSSCVELFRKDYYEIEDLEHKIHFPI